MHNTSKTSQCLTSIPISVSVEFQLSKLMNKEKSYSKVIQNLITHYWKHNGNWNKNNNIMRVQDPAKSSPETLQAMDTLGVVNSEVG